MNYYILAYSFKQRCIGTVVQFTYVNCTTVPVKNYIKQKSPTWLQGFLYIIKRFIY